MREIGYGERGHSTFMSVLNLVLVALLLSQKHQFGVGVQIRWSGAQNRSLLKPRRTRSPSTKCRHGGTGNPEGDALSYIGRIVRGHSVLGRDVRAWGTIYPRTKCPGDSFS